MNTSNSLTLETDWPCIKAVFQRAQRSALCHSFATVNSDGSPNITAIGSLILDDDSPKGYYFDIFNRCLGQNLNRNPDVAILAVDNRKLFWLFSLVKRRFKTPPALRLIGSVGSQRRATDEEIQRCLKDMKHIKRLGASEMLAKRLKLLRPVCFTRVDVLNLGPVTFANASHLSPTP